jgi:hypothetical protein
MAGLTERRPWSFPLKVAAYASQIKDWSKVSPSVAAASSRHNVTNTFTSITC